MWNADIPSQQKRWLLLIPFGLYLTLGILYTVAIPSGESPDEPGHLRCVEQVSRLGRIPQVDPQPSGEWWQRETVLSGRMCYHMPLYYLVAGGMQWTVHQLSNAPLDFQFPPTNPHWGASPAIFEHETSGLLGQMKEPGTVLVVRLLSLVAGASTIWATYVIAGRLYPHIEAVGVAAATLVAGWPQYVFMSRAISNDVLAAALAALVLVVLLVDIGQPRRYLYAGVLAALAILTRLNMAFVLAPLAIAFALELTRAGKRLRRHLLWGALAAVPLLLAAALIVWHPTLRDHLRLTSLFFQDVRPEALQLRYWLDVAGLTLQSGWALLGWMNVPTPVWQSVVWWGFLLGGSLLGLWQLLAAPAAVGWHKTLIMVIILTWFAAVLAAFVRINLNRFQPQFRFMFSLVPLLATLAAGGYLSFAADKGQVRLAPIVSIAFLLLLANVAILVFTVVPAYG
ncbi:MAG TPA: glycosyltransferase family 39 protein [Candidatus Sulfomarinibacteraceae bacterium]|nr:glycosyltransferase family 39 protein [Candidatus Sulfomarinibacteraceae bacterium]